MQLQPREATRADRGMVCTVDHLAAEAGCDILRSGGNAVDAAIAAGAVLAVTAQHMCGMGGDLYAIVFPPGGGGPAVLNASGRAGSGADAKRMRREGHLVMPFRDDVRAVTVPGCADGWLALHERFANLPLAELLAPARRIARDGFAVSPTLATAAAALGHLPGADDFRVRPPLRSGDIVRRPGLERALAAIVEEGRGGFYEGEFGRGLLSMGGGEFSPADLANPCAGWVEPIACEAWGRKIWSAPPVSQGYVTLASAWIASGLRLPAGSDDALWAHLLIEAARQASFDRNEVLHEGADGAALLDPRRLEPRRRAIDPEHAASLARAAHPGGTAALCTVDERRMGVSMLQSNAAGFGAMLVEPGTGIFLHNRGIGFSLQEGHPAEYGPGRRPPHTLCPTAVTDRDGRLLAVLATMGGDSQPQILLQLLTRLLPGGEEPADALGAARWVLRGGDNAFETWHTGSSVRVMLEDHSPPAWAPRLSDLGHEVLTTEPFDRAFGYAQLISLVDDHLDGASDPRSRFGAAAGF